MWLWITIGLNFIATVHGYKNKPFPSACISMSPTHHAFSGELVSAQTSSPPFEIDYKHGGMTEPVTVILRGKSAKFRGFLLEARLKNQNNNAVPVGKFILIDPRTTTHQECNGVPDSAVRHVSHGLKESVQVNWTASEGEMDVTFRATVVSSRVKYWENVNRDLTFPTTTIEPSTTTTTERSTTTTTEPSTTTTTEPIIKTTTEPSTTTTTEPSTTTTTEPSTRSTTEPTAMSTTEPSTPSTTEPTATSTTESTTTDLTALSTTVSTTRTTTKPTAMGTTESTTTSTIEPTALSTTVYTTRTTTKPTATSTTESTPTTEPPTKYTPQLRKAVILTSVTSSMKQMHLSVSVIPSNNVPRPLKKGLKVSWCVLCTGIETAALILLNMGHCYGVILALVFVATVIDFIQLLINCLPLGPSHELKDICDLVDKVCLAIHEIFAVAIIFVGIQKISSSEPTEHWFGIVMISYAVWISLFVTWVFISHSLSKSVHDAKWCRQRKRELRSKEKTLIAASVVVSVVAIFFTAAITYHDICLEETSIVATNYTDGERWH